MNISNIQVGSVYKNYKELCYELEEKPKTGNAKKAQIKEFERYFSYTKQGNKFIIDRIYDKPKVKQDLRSQGNNVSFYMEDIEELILDLLGQERNKGQLFLSRNRLLKELKMINENYTYYRNKKPALSKFMNIHIEEVNDFYESSNSTFKSNLETALNRLQKQSLIYWTYALTVCFISTHAATTDTGYIKAVKRERITEDGEKITTYDTVQPVNELVYRRATKEEIRIILEIERDLLEKFNCKDKSELYKRGELEEFYKKVKNILFERTNILFYYNSYEILFNDRHIQEKLEELRLGETKKYFTQEILNAGVIEKLSDNAKNRHEKAITQYFINGLDDESELNEKVKIRIENKYIENNDLLAEKLINKDTAQDEIEINN